MVTATLFSFLQGEICCPGKHQLQDQIRLRRAPSVARRHLHQVPAKRHHSQQAGETQLGEPFCLKLRRGLAFIFGEMISGAANLEQGAFAYWPLLGKWLLRSSVLAEKDSKMCLVQQFPFMWRTPELAPPVTNLHSLSSWDPKGHPLFLLVFS